MQHQLSEQSFTFEAFDWEPECESAYHHTDNADLITHHHAARYFVAGPCKHVTGYRCESSALDGMSAREPWCSQCRSFWPRDRFSFYLLGV